MQERLEQRVHEVPAVSALTHPRRIVAGVCFVPEEENGNVVQPSMRKGLVPGVDNCMAEERCGTLG